MAFFWMGGVSVSLATPQPVRPLRVEIESTDPRHRAALVKETAGAWASEELKAVPLFRG
jgi:hypothetical protein